MYVDNTLFVETWVVYFYVVYITRSVSFVDISDDFFFHSLFSGNIAI
jgi:hypothetical protein